MFIGVDEGLISGTLAKSDFKTKLGLDLMDDAELADVKGNISAMVQIGSVGGAALLVYLSYILENPLLVHVPSPNEGAIPSGEESLLIGIKMGI